MSRLPRVSGGECVKALTKIGYYLKRQAGSHRILRRDEPIGQLSCLITGSWIKAHSERSFEVPD